MTWAQTGQLAENQEPIYEDLPEGWLRVKLPDVATVTMGQSPPGSSYNDRGEGLPFFQGKAEFGERYPKVRVWCTEPKKIANSGDVLISIRAPVGPTNVADRRCIIGRGLASVTPLGGMPTEYVLFAFRLIESELSISGTGSTFTAINKKNLEEIEIDVPPLAEQKRIVAKVEQLLTRVNAARERLAKVPEILKRFRQSVLAAACSGRLTADWRDGHLDLKPAVENLKRVLANRRTEWETGQLRKMRAAGKLPKNNMWKAKYKQPASPELSDPPELPDSWYWVTIEQMASVEPRSIQSGPFGSNLLHSEFQDTGILSIGIDNVLDGKFSIGREHRISNQKYQELKKYTARPLDVLITVMATIGRCCVVPEDIEAAIITKHVYRITVDRSVIDPYYLMLALRGDTIVWRQINNQIRGQTRPGINGQILKNLAIPTPPLTEQKEIVGQAMALFGLVDKTEKRAAAAMAHAERLTQAILAEAFCGELVPTEAELARREGRSYDPASALLAKIETQRKDVKPERKRGRLRRRKRNK